MSGLALLYDTVKLAREVRVGAREPQWSKIKKECKIWGKFPTRLDLQFNQKFWTHAHSPLGTKA